MLGLDKIVNTARPVPNILTSAAPPEPTEATLGFSSNRKAIDFSPVRRYCFDQKKGGLNFYIQIKKCM